MATFTIDGRQYESADVRRFVARVEVDATSGCWHWVGAAGGFRHGTFTKYDGDQMVQVSARRFAWAANHGSITRGQFVRTTCGTEECVNPDHLVLVEDGVEAAKAGAGPELLADRVVESAVIMSSLVGNGK